MEWINGAHTAWVLMSATLVMLMTPGLGLFYAGWCGRRTPCRPSPTPAPALAHLWEELAKGLTAAR